LNVLDVRSFRAADCDTDHYLVVVKVRERLAERLAKITQISYGSVDQLILSQMKEESSDSLHAGAIGALTAFKLLSHEPFFPFVGPATDVAGISLLDKTKCGMPIGCLG
jgi:hypothetical protein